MPDTKELKPAAGSIAGVVDEVKAFLTEDLAHKKEDLEKILSELESKLSGVLKTAKGAEAKVKSTVGSILKNSEDSPLYNSVQELKGAAQNVEDHYESIRNRISGLLDRLHL